MKNIQLTSKANDDDWSMKFVDDADYDELYDEDVYVLKPDGSPLMVLLKQALSPQNTAKAWSVLKDFNTTSKNRGVATGIKTKGRTLVSGIVSKFNQVPKGWEVISGIIGSFERTVRAPLCRSCSWNSRYPAKFEKVFPMAQDVSELFRTYVPERYAAQKAYVDRTHPQYVIPGTVFTTLTINKNFRTACHKDAGDLEAGFSCLSVIKRGVYKGGNLVLPNWRIAAKLETFDLIMFDAHQFHGNTQIVPLTKDAERCSIVYYFREKMVLCKSPAEELKQLKARKPGQPIWEAQ